MVNKQEVKSRVRKNLAENEPSLEALVEFFRQHENFPIENGNEIIEPDRVVEIVEGEDTPRFRFTNLSSSIDY